MKTFEDWLLSIILFCGGAVLSHIFLLEPAYAYMAGIIAGHVPWFASYAKEWRKI